MVIQQNARIYNKTKCPENKNSLTASNIAQPQKQIRFNNSDMSKCTIYKWSFNNKYDKISIIMIYTFKQH